MTDKKILFTDLDDTLLDSRKRISEKNHRAVLEALDAGHRVVFNSGRPLVGMLPQLEELGLDKDGCFAVAYNGGLVYDCFRGETVFKKPSRWRTSRRSFSRRGVSACTVTPTTADRSSRPPRRRSWRNTCGRSVCPTASSRSCPTASLRSP